jgi:hypothetical protein
LPVSESEVFYHPRLGRTNLSRLTLRPMRSVKSLVLIAGPGPTGPTIYTVYGGSKPVEREVSDPTLPDAALAASAAFWAEHALASPNLILTVINNDRQSWVTETGNVKVVGQVERMVTDIQVGTTISYLVASIGTKVKIYDSYFTRWFVFGENGWTMEDYEEN